MEQKTKEGSFPQGPGISTNPDVIQAALHFLMTRYQERPCAGLARAVVHHLELLLGHPEFDPNGVTRVVYLDLLTRWRTLDSDWASPVATASATGKQQSVH